MKLFKVATWADGDIAAPSGLNAELQTQLAQLNGGLDAENMESSTLLHTMMDADDDPWLLWSSVKDSSGNALAPTNTGVGQAHKLEAGAGYLESSAEWKEGVVNIMASAMVECSASSLWTWTLVVVVDGHMVAESGCSTASKTSSRKVVCAVPVAAGTRHIEVLIRFFEANPDVTVQNCQLFAYQMVV